MKIYAIYNIYEGQTETSAHTPSIYKLSSKGYQPLPLRPDSGEL